MTITKTKAPPQSVRSAVNAYLMQRAYAETMRQAVDEVHLAILTQCPIYANRYRGDHSGTGELILKSGNLYLAAEEDEAEVQEFYSEANHRLRECGLKPKGMKDSHCPALVEEHNRIKTEWLLCECGAEMLGVDDPKNFHNDLLCHGLAKVQEFIDLLCGLVVNEPGYKNPMTD